jgi:hypothetical protein
MAGKPDSLWPPVSGLRDTALLLAGLVLVAALADGALATWLSTALVVLSALVSLRDGSVVDSSWSRLDERALMVSWLVPLFIAITVATFLFEGDWFVVAIVAIATPLVTLGRIGLVLWFRRGTHRARGTT